ncbi:MAG: flavin-containing monooxygenase [Candidatus Dormibacteria bacterium]
MIERHLAPAGEHRRVVIIGAGFGGLGMAIRLKQEGVDDFVVLERALEVGGVWHYNTYPGCMCDVPSHLYSLSTAPNPNWSRTYSPQAEIRDYLRDCVDRFDLRSHIHTGVTVDEAVWRDDQQVWEIQTSDGTLIAEILVNATGPLTEPKLPDVPGMERFKGKMMHSARWDHEYQLKGRRVASIGTGASAIQYVPEIQNEVEHLLVFQRTPPWIMPHSDRDIRDWERALYRRLPIAQRLVREAVFYSKELLVPGFVKDPKWMGIVQKLATKHMQKQISDPELLRKVTPDYTIGCKRLLPSNRWYPALQAPNVELVTAGLREVRETSVVDSDGVEREVDTIIFGTGFHVTDTPYAQLYRGREGALLSDVWRGSPRAYLGTTVPGFPNLFLLAGPNTGVGHTSLVYMIEAQVEHVLLAMRAMDAAGAATVEVRAQAHIDFNQELDARMARTVWSTGGCASWYIDGTGRNASQWPDWAWRFRRRARQFDSNTYALNPPEPARNPARKPVGKPAAKPTRTPEEAGV